MCVGYIQIQAILHKGLEHPWLLVFTEILVPIPLWYQGRLSSGNSWMEETPKARYVGKGTERPCRLPGPPPPSMWMCSQPGSFWNLCHLGLLWRLYYIGIIDGVPGHWWLNSTSSPSSIPGGSWWSGGWRGGSRLKVPTLLTASLPNTPLSLLPALQLAPILWNFTEVIPITIKSGAVEIDLEWIPETQFMNSLLVQWLGGPHFHCWGRGFNIWWGNQDPLSPAGRPRPKQQQQNPKRSSPVSSGAILRAVEQKLPLKLSSLRKSQGFKKLFVEPVVWSPLPSDRRSSWRKFQDPGSEHPRRWKSAASVRGPGGHGKCLCHRPHDPRPPAFASSPPRDATPAPLRQEREGLGPEDSGAGPSSRLRVSRLRNVGEGGGDRDGGRGAVPGGQQLALRHCF